MQHKPFIDQVREFHEKFYVPILDSPQIPSKARVKLRVDFIEEELKELKDAIAAGDLVEIADAFIDLHYYISGASLEFGIPELECFAEIHRSNMSKLWPYDLVNQRFLTEQEILTVCYHGGIELRPKYRDDGKVLKSPTYSPANLKPILGL